jgi:hypothetical protein
MDRYCVQWTHITAVQSVIQIADRIEC